MKKMIAMMLALVLALISVAALAEAAGEPEAVEATEAAEAPEAVEEEQTINCLIEEGSFIIQIPTSYKGMNWVADDMAQDDTVVKLYDADVIEDTFVARYDPVGDGDMTVGVRHYVGIACDELYTWDLHVEGGAVTEVTGGSHVGSPEEFEIDPYTTGEWIEQDTGFTQMTIEKNIENGWNVEIAAPLTHGAYIFKATIYYDCDREAFVYDKGKFWDVPVTDSEEEGDLGEAKIAGATGSFAFGGDSIENATLTWHDDDSAETDIVFVRAGGDDAAAEPAAAEEPETAEEPAAEEPAAEETAAEEPAAEEEIVEFD